MWLIEGVVFEPVGCLAEFGATEFNEIVSRVFGRKKRHGKSGSHVYWRLLSLMQRSDKKLGASEKKVIEELEIQAVNNAELYEDVVPALSELKTLGTKLLIASSLSAAALDRFLEKNSLNDFFPQVWNRDNAGGVGIVPVFKALQSAALAPERVMVLADTEEGLNVAKDLGVNSILMINDYDEGRRLALHPPTGGIVSLAELPDAIRLIAENARLSRS